MGSRGPIPKRSEERHRRNTDYNTVQVPVSATAEVTPPERPLNWCKAAQRIWDSLVESRQSVFFQPSDWAYAWFMCDEITRYVKNKKQNGQVLSSINTMLTSLLMTEGERRRAGIEIVNANKTDEGDAVVESMEKWARKAKQIG